MNGRIQFRARCIDFGWLVERARLKDEEGAIGGGRETGIEAADTDFARNCEDWRVEGCRSCRVMRHSQSNETGVTTGKLADVNGVVAVPCDPVGGGWSV